MLDPNDLKHRQLVQYGLDLFQQSKKVVKELAALLLTDEGHIDAVLYRNSDGSGSVGEINKRVVERTFNQLLEMQEEPESEVKEPEEIDA